MMVIKRIDTGVYKVTDSKGVWIMKGGVSTVNGQWQAFECENEEDCSDENNWGVSFKTKKELIKYSQSFE